MNLLRTGICILLLLSTVGAHTAYMDDDLDGVDNTLDLCPNTSFDDLVDEHGCPFSSPSSSSQGVIQLGATRNIDNLYADNTLFSFYASYRYGDWEFALSSANYNTAMLSSVIDAEDDLFVTLGYHHTVENLDMVFSAGTKFAFLKENGKRDNDYHLSVNLNYDLTEKIDLLGFYSYTFSSDSPNIDYRDFQTFSIGAGYTVTSKWYTSLSYNEITPYYEGADHYRTLSWFSAYMLSSTLYVSLNYAYGLSEQAYDHAVTMNIGVHFE